MGNRHFRSHYVNNEPSQYEPHSRKAKKIWGHLHKKSTHPDDNTPAAISAQDIDIAKRRADTRSVLPSNPMQQQPRENGLMRVNDMYSYPQ